MPKSFIKVLIHLQKVHQRWKRLWDLAYLQSLRNKGAYIGENVFTQNLSVEEKFSKLLHIDDDVVFAYGVRIILHDSSLNNIYGIPVKFGKVTIRKGAYIGARSTILPGVEIGERAIVGASSLVTKDIPSASVAYGIPAHVMDTTENLKTKFLENMAHNKKIQESPFYYLDTPPWRKRKSASSVAEINMMYEHFLESVK
jgi:acetyltransferase-like isoleucine patch superfamily enzyme